MKSEGSKQSATENSDEEAIARLLRRTQSNPSQVG